MTKGWKNESERHSLSAKGIQTKRGRVNVISNPLTVDFRKLKEENPLSHGFYMLQARLGDYGVYLNYINEDDNYVYFRPENRRTGEKSHIQDINKKVLLNVGSDDVRRILDDIGSW